MIRAVIAVTIHGAASVVSAASRDETTHSDVRHRCPARASVARGDARRLEQGQLRAGFC